MIALVLAALGAAPAAAPAPDPAWTRGAVCYEVFVRSFYDSDGDGTGDLNGLIQKLDYINDGHPNSRTSLGASCIWLMPIDASPSYHGYDVSDYYRVEPAYGTNDDFKHLMREAHRRGIRVFVDFVPNHSSSRNPWFEAALRDTASPYRGWYRFSPTDLGRGPWGAPAWHHSPVRDEYYYGVFSPGMPDLNYESPGLREEMKRVATFWLRDMGADGFRLDAVPYMLEEGACQAGCPGTHAYLHEWAEHVHSIRPDAWTVGEAWGNIAMVLPYYPDQLTSYFGFELADSLLRAVNRGTVGGMLSGYLRLQDTLPSYRWSPFLSNHDQTRVMTTLGSDPAKARVAATLLLTLPGLPFVYYGEELGMTGAKPDPQLRTPMQWSAGAGVGFTTGTPWESPNADAPSVNAAAQESDRGSLLNLYRRLIHLRKQNVALATGRLVQLTANDECIVTYLRREGHHAVFVIENLGAETASSVTISSSGAALPPGTYAARNLLGDGANGAVLRVGPDGQIRDYRPGTIGPRQSLVFDLIRR